MKRNKLSEIKRVRLEAFLRSLKGHIFSVEFTKKDNTKRVMNARLSVSKSVKGTGKPNGFSTPCIKVYDMQKQAYRQINLSTVKKLRANGVEYKVVS